MANVLEIKDLKFSWPGEQESLLDISSFSLKKAEKLFLQGPSGSGKSTLLNLIGGVLKPSSGQISILQHDLTKNSSAAIDNIRGDHLGFIFQSFNLLPYFSAVENVLLGAEFSKAKKEASIKNGTSLEDEARRLLTELQLDPNKIEKLPVSQLSIGQQQRVATARALIGRPDLIIADEPSSALDASTKKQFVDLLFSECSKYEISLLFVSHDHELGDIFDRRVHLKDINSSYEKNHGRWKDVTL